jgi:hypothetical protein
MEIESLPIKSVRMLAMFYSIQWSLKLPGKLFRPSRALVAKQHTGRTGDDSYITGEACSARKQSGLYRLQGAARAFSP